MARKITEGQPASTDKTLEQYPNNYDRLSDPLKNMIDRVGGVEGIERGMQSQDPAVRRGAAILVAFIFDDLSRR